jgi:hypothetical protein
VGNLFQCIGATRYSRDVVGGQTGFNGGGNLRFIFDQQYPGRNFAKGISIREGTDFSNSDGFVGSCAYSDCHVQTFGRIRLLVKRELRFKFAFELSQTKTPGRISPGVRVSILISAYLPPVPVPIPVPVPVPVPGVVLLLGGGEMSGVPGVAGNPGVDGLLRLRSVPVPVPVPVLLPGAPVLLASTPKCEFTRCAHAESIVGQVVLLNVGALCNFELSTFTVN